MRPGAGSQTGIEGDPTAHGGWDMGEGNAIRVGATGHKVYSRVRHQRVPGFVFQGHFAVEVRHIRRIEPLVYILPEQPPTFSQVARVVRIVHQTSGEEFTSILKRR